LDTVAKKQQTALPVTTPVTFPVAGISIDGSKAMK
jgi:hypothetical protein